MDELTFYTRLLSLPHVQLTGITVTEKRIKIACTLTDTQTRCPLCGVVCPVVNDRTTRRVRDLNIPEREVYLLGSVRQFRCPTCGSCPTERLPFADTNKSYTHRQARYVFAVARKQAYGEVGAVVGMPAKTVERLVLHECGRALQLPEQYAGLRRLGLDEQSHRKGKKHFICLLTNLDTGTLVDILPNRKKETLLAYFQVLGQEFLPANNHCELRHLAAVSGRSGHLFSTSHAGARPLSCDQTTEPRLGWIAATLAPGGAGGGGTQAAQVAALQAVSSPIRCRVGCVARRLRRERRVKDGLFSARTVPPYSRPATVRGLGPHLPG